MIILLSKVAQSKVEINPFQSFGNLSGQLLLLCESLETILH